MRAQARTQVGLPTAPVPPGTGSHISMIRMRASARKSHQATAPAGPPAGSPIRLMTRPRVKQQHWVPRLYLRGWSDSKDKIWCFSKNDQTISNPNITNVAGGRWFNDLRQTLDPTNPELFQGVERLLARIEGMCAPIIRALREESEKYFLAHPDLPFDRTNLLSPKGRGVLADFMALQYLRTDERRGFIRQSINKILQMGMEESMPIALPNIDPKKFTIKATEEEIKRQHLQQLLKFHEYSQYFLNRYWMYGINLHDTSFVTSDNPVVRFGKRLHRAIPCDGLDSPAMRLLFPISPRLIIIMYDRQHFSELASWDGGLDFVTEEAVGVYNRLQLKQCSRHIYSANSEFEFASTFCRKNPAVCSPEWKSFEPQGPYVDKMISAMVTAAHEYNAERSD